MVPVAVGKYRGQKITLLVIKAVAWKALYPAWPESVPELCHAMAYAQSVESRRYRLRGVIEQMQIDCGVFCRGAAEHRADQSRMMSYERTHYIHGRLTELLEVRQVAVTTEYSVALGEGLFNFSITGQWSRGIHTQTFDGLRLGGPEIIQTVFLNNSSSFVCYGRPAVIGPES